MGELLTAKEKKKILQEYGHILAQIKNLEMEIAQLRQSQMSASVNMGDGMPRSLGGPTDLSDYAVKLDSLLSHLEKTRERCIRTKLMIETAITEMPDIRERNLMWLRYVRCLPWDEVALELKYEIRQVFRIHGQALLHIEFRFEQQCQ